MSTAPPVPPTSLECPMPECTYITGDKTEAVAVALLNAHMYLHKQSTVKRGGSTLKPPSIEEGATMEVWNNFERKWKMYKEGERITGSDVSYHLFHCAESALGDALLKSDPDISSKGETEILEQMKNLAVIPVATGIVRAELLEMKQLRDEAFRKFAARVRGKAETCEYYTSFTCQKTTCTHVSNVDFTDHIMRDVLLAGIYDADIRREMYGVESILTQSINTVISMVEKKEMARDAHSAGSASGISSMKQQRKIDQKQQQRSEDVDRTKQAPCPKCKKSYPLYREGKFGWNSKPYNMCRDCFRSQRRPKSSQQNASVSQQEEPANCGIIVANVSTISVNPSSSTRSSSNRSKSTPPVVSHSGKMNALSSANIRMDHHVFSKGEWRRAKLMDHPTWSTHISVRRKDYSDFSRPCPQIPSNLKVMAKLDTCAMSCLWSRKEFLAAGFKESDLIPVSLGLNAANKSSIKIDGAVLVRLAVTVAGQTRTCATMVYISPSSEGFFMSLEAMLDLDLFKIPAEGSNMACTKQADDDKSDPSQQNPSCPCPPRSVPHRPDKLPFPAVPENNLKMESWIKDHFAPSVFNTCSNQPLPKMSGPPIEIHLKDGAVPYKAQTAVSIPINWQDHIKELYKNDLNLGVIEPAPADEDNEWCHREVYVAKSSGKPRRCIDYKPGLNRWVKRDAYATESPFHVVKRIPGNTWKTVTDAWNGYHLIPLHPDSKKFTTFISMEGKFRYTRCPQGASFSGDAYNRRHANITAEVPRKETVVDDTCLYDDSNELEQHWWRVIDYLVLCGKNGIILNPDKFQFSRECVDFAGFRVSNTSTEPLPKYIDAIKDFPTPKSITDIRSWFGLVNQLANYSQLREMMRPFRAFLSPKTPFVWTDELQKCFEDSKADIIKAIKHGVTIYDPKKITCLRTDWSNQGLGYHLSQKHCDCQSDLPGCCEDGWQVTLAGSRFLIGPEQRYVAIEGEALAIAWALEQTKYFTLGCENLIVATDHKPLVAIFQDKELTQIANPRIFRLKQRTLWWTFKIVYLAGSTNSAADAVSRHPSPNDAGTCDATLCSVGAEPLSQHPSPNGELSYGDCSEIALVAGGNRKASTCTPILWPEIVTETASDSTLCLLMSTITHGFPEKAADLSSDLIPYWSIRNQLQVDNDVVWYNDRIVLPPSLRARALDVLHSAHQGVSGMTDRAQSVVYWPGITEDIQRARSSCKACCRNAPSQAALPATPPECPETPFEAVFADFFEESGHHYLVAGDRLSGWVEVYSSPVGSAKAGAKGLIAQLRTMFTTFGVPNSLSSDGGPEFSASATEQFLSLWGVQHRESAAYHPQSNGRAEVAVKKAKRLLKTCIGPNGSLNNDQFMMGMLQLRNTPDPDCKLSPAQILFGRPLRDGFSFASRGPKFNNDAVHPIWRDAWAAKESALRTRFAKSVEKLNSNARLLPQLHAGEKVFIQNQNGPHPNKWDRSGVVLENIGYNQYRVKVDGSGRVTNRNRRFLRLYTLPTTTYVQKSDSVPMNLVDQSVPSSPKLCEPEPSPECSVDQESIPITAPIPTPPLIVQEPVPIPASIAEPSQSGGSNIHVESLPGKNLLPKRKRGRPSKDQRILRNPNLRNQHQKVMPSTLQPSEVPSTSQPSEVPAASDSPSSLPDSSSGSVLAPSRPTRIRCSPKFYDAATGKWT